MEKGGRIRSIDMLRGIVMVLMVLDHVRGFFYTGPKPTDLSETHFMLFATRWVTHFCAPVFIFLAGASAFMYGAKYTKRDLRRFLMTRGIWLIFLELTVIRFGWVHELGSMFILQVIWALGTGMLLLGVLASLRPQVIMVIGICVVFGHNAIGPAVVEALSSSYKFVGQLLLTRGVFAVGLVKVHMAYAVLPWFGVMALGYGFGAYYLQASPAMRRTICIRVGVAAMAMFAVLRGLNLYGDPTDWSILARLDLTIMSFLNLTKYPPSLLYLLMTLGPAIFLLPHLEHWSFTRFGRLSLLFGKVPMLFYILHLYFVSYGSQLLSLLLGQGTALRRGIGLGLPEVWLVWGLMILLLAPICYWYGNYKKRHDYWWLSYL